MSAADVGFMVVSLSPGVLLLACSIAVEIRRKARRRRLRERGVME